MKFLFGLGKKTDKAKPPTAAEAAAMASGNFKVAIKDGFQGGGKPLTMDDFKLLKVLGKGSFGKVMLVTKNGDKSKTLLAMKTLRKSELIKRNQLAHTATERHVLQHLDHPFLVKLVYAFQTADKLYMVLEFMGGGELFHWLKEHRRFSEQRAKLYCAEIGLGLSALHDRDIIYRDLKPENLLLDTKGHIRITDFGLSKAQVTGFGAEGGTKTYCGTPEYLAPEILEHKDYGKAVDWWSYGTLLYEMLCGLPPFYDPNHHKMEKKILIAPLKFPSYLSKDAKDVLEGLLRRNVEDRLGSKGDFADIKAHAFNADLDFVKVYNKEYTPEFQPAAVADPTSHFDAEFTREKAMDSVVVSKLSEEQAYTANFSGFTYNPPTNMD
ncbi:kinase-like domain-containing protein [Pelagophyceae sp. CCMP2097]|nr:kinase-like domain-containing protein [Pelagophyceae sp. CCMP2097]